LITSPTTDWNSSPRLFPDEDDEAIINFVGMTSVRPKLLLRNANARVGEQICANSIVVTIKSMVAAARRLSPLINRKRFLVHSCWGIIVPKTLAR
jgi:hypothetical protein